MGFSTRWPAVCLISCALGLLSGQTVAPADGMVSQAPTGSGSGSLSGNPLVVPGAESLVEGQTAAAEEARRSSPEAVAAREASSTAYEGVSSASARAIVGEAFPGIVTDPAGGPPPLPAGVKATGFPTDYAMSVALPGEQHGVFASLVPIAMESGEGQRDPIDLGLDESGSAFRPVRPLVQVRLSKRLDEGAALESSGVSLVPVAQDGSSLSGAEGVVDGASVFYGDSEDAQAGVVDVDTLVKPDTFGFSTETVLRSQRSPQRLFFKVRMPEGSSLVQAPGGAVKVVDAGQVIATVLSPSAHDAEGVTVPVTLSVASDDTLALEVAHSDGQYRMPILVDPTVTDTTLETSSYGSEHESNWVYEHSGSAYWVGEEAGKGYSEQPHLVDNGYAASGEYGVWAYAVQGESHIYGFISETSSEGEHVQNELAIVNPSRAYEGRKTYPSAYAKTTTELCVEIACASGKVTSTNEGNVAYFQQDGEGATHGSFIASMWKASVEILQEKGPFQPVFNETSATVGPGASNVLYTHGWLGPNSKSAFEASGTDPGLGINKWWFKSPTSSEWHDTGVTELNECVTCTEGTTTNPALVDVERAGELICIKRGCYKPEHRLADGEDTIEFWDSDAVGLYGAAKTVTVNVDGTAPYNIGISGLPPNREIGNGLYILKGSAKDGSGTTPSSGIASFTLKVNGKQVGVPHGSCSPGPCTASAEWTVSGAEFPVGQDEVTLTATDNAGNVGSEKFTMFVARPTSPMGIGPGTVDPQSGELHLGATDASVAALGGNLTVSRSYGSLHLTAGSEGPLGPQWSLSTDSAQNVTKLPDGDVLLTTGSSLQAVFTNKGSGEFTPAKGNAGLLLTEKTVEGKVDYVLKDSSGSVTTFTPSSAGGGTVWLPTKREQASGANVTSISYNIVGSTVDPTEMLAPKPAGVSSCSPELVKGCRALRFVYAATTTATGDAQSAWGDYAGRLKEITFTAWDPSSSKMVTKTVDALSYDKEGKLRAEWDPRVSPTLKTTYGYDAEGHITAVSYPGQEPWLVRYGMIAGDPRTGRVLAVDRFGASTTLGNGLPPVNTSLPSISGTVSVGKSLSVSSGTWENGLLDYNYQWERCNSAGGECVAIEGATNTHYVVPPSAVGHVLRVRVLGTNSDGTGETVTATTGVVPAPEWYFRQFGSAGSGNGEFNSPNGVAVDLKGNVWVVDTANNRIEEFSASGEFLAAYGSSGTGPGQFSNPTGIAINNYVYVVDTGNNRVEKFETNGKYVSQFGTAGTGNGQFNEPTGIALSETTMYGEGAVYVVDSGNSRVELFSLSPNKYQSQFGSAGTEVGKFTKPEGIGLQQEAGGCSAHVYIADTGNKRIQKYCLATKTFESAITSGPACWIFSWAPWGIAMAGGEPYVADQPNGCVDYFSEKNGNIGSRTAEPYYGQFKSPEWVARTSTGEQSGSLYVTDHTGDYVVQISPKSLPDPPVAPPTPPSLTTTAVTTIEYHVPVSGKEAPYALGVKEVEAWGQKDDPVEATAIFPPDEPMGWPAKDYKRATINYLDAKGRTVNVAMPGGGISTSEYNETNDLVRSLTPDNRAIALNEGTKSAEVSTSLDTQSTYNPEGNELSSVLGPRHQVRLPNGKEVQARNHTVYSYNEGVPSEGGPYDLVTKTTQGAQIEGEAEQDIRTTTTSYSGQEGLGWKLRKPTSVTADPAGLKITHTTLYDAATENVIETRMPKSTGSESAHDTITVYYTSAANSSYPACGERAEWAGLPCKTRPAKQPGTSGLPELPVTQVTSYNMWDEPLIVSSTSGSATRTTKDTYDEAGRQLKKEISSTVGEALSPVTFEYNAETGALEKEKTTSGEKTQSITHVLNTLGQLTTYTDADGNSATYKYDTDGRPTDVNDGKGTQTYTYDTTTGFPTKLVDTAAGTFTATYDVEGNLLTEGYPNGMTATYTRNQTRQATGLEYVKTTHCTEKCQWFVDKVSPSIHGQWLSQTSTQATNLYTYDSAGRITQDQDTPAGKGCITRIYAYDEDTNRTSLTTRAPGSEGKCATEGGTSESHSYDEADRLTDTGVAYDAYGNTSKLPAADAGGSELVSSFYVDSQLASQTQNGQTIGYNLDPAGRIRETVSTGKITATEIDHYAGPGSTPAWSGEISGQWTRNIGGLGGGLAAIEHNGETPILQLTNLRGDIIATATESETATGPASTVAEASEYGVPATEAPPKYSWLGAHEMPTELPSGVITMGARSYVPQLGRFLQTDSQPGGSANSYTYTFGDPINTTDLTGESALPSWFKEFAAEKANLVAEEVAAREAAAREAAARAEAERRAAEAAAQAAAYAAMVFANAGGEYYEEEGWEEEWWEEGEWEYVSYDRGAQHEKSQVEPGLLYQPLSSTDTSENEITPGNGEESGTQGHRLDVMGGCPSVEAPCWKGRRGYRRPRKSGGIGNVCHAGPFATLAGAAFGGVAGVVVAGIVYATACNGR